MIDWKIDDGVNIEMINDYVRNQFYESIISQNVKNKKVVDIGFGTGLLSILCLKHGASNILAFESHNERYELGLEIINKCGLGDKIQLVNERYNWQTTIDTDIIITETVNGDLWQEGLWNSLPRTNDVLFLPGEYFTELYVKQVPRSFAEMLDSDIKSKSMFMPGVDLDKQFLALQELLVSNICAAHRITSKTLMGIDTNNGFTSNADELINAANFYQNTVVRGFQLNILNTLQTIFSVNNIDLPVEFVQLKPITVQFDSKTIREVMTIDEIRSDLGLEPLEQDEDTVEQDVKLSKVGMIDGKPVFDTIEEAEAHAKTLGCEGYHEHDLEGQKVYMACKGHTEATELESFIEEFGEEIPEGYEIISEEEAEEETEEFDFEAELHSEYYEFASTGAAYPNRKSGQDQKSKQTEYVDDIYRVRYRYTGSLKGERDFCRKMTSSNKIYRKEDIIAMGRKAVNPGWGKGGANTYSIWKWKGGALCKHKWFRIILVQKGKRPKNSDKIITSTEAKSRGVKLPRNAKEVSVAPHDMPNHGFVNPELIAKYKNVR